MLFTKWSVQGMSCTTCRLILTNGYLNGVWKEMPTEFLCGLPHLITHNCQPAAMGL